MVTATTSVLPPASYEPRKAAPLKSKTAHRVDLANLTPNNVGQFRKLNSVLFPVRYSESFYKDALESERKPICQLALFNDMPVGNLCCRYEYSWPSDSSDSTVPTVNIYIMTLGVLAPYRRLGIAKKLISHLITVAGPGTDLDLPNPDPAVAAKEKAAKQDNKKTNDKAGSTTAAKPPRPTKKFRVESLYLHVQTTNAEARDFYKAQGFTEEETIEEYYRKGVEPRSAVLLVKK